MKPILEMHRPDPEVVDRLEKELRCHRAIATVLANRGIRSLEQAHGFLFPKLADLRPPFAMAGMDRAVDRIVMALEKKEKILIFGDYDADGVTSALVLGSFFQATGHFAKVYLPHRIDEGYGLKTRHIQEVAVPDGITLIVTVDCGASSHEAVEAAAALGIDVVVTDHHRQPDPLPRAVALVNPQRKDCTAGFESLAGVGVAFALTVCLRSRLREMGFWTQARPEPDLRRLCDLVALGTVADICPMTADNRILTHAGLSVINQGLRPGLAALTAACSLKPGRVTATDIAFKLSPRINVAGRLGHASLAFDLLTESDPDRAHGICRRLNQMNSRRQELENSVMEQIRRQLDKAPERLEAPALVFFQADWHPGVLGIVASRLARAHCRPTILLSLADGKVKGSGRSVAGINLYACLKECRRVLEGFGGHAQAAGLSLERHRLAEFENLFLDAIGRQSSPEDFVPRIRADFCLDVNSLTLDFARAVESLGPFGSQNPEPVFVASNLSVVSSKRLGGRHLKMTIGQTGAQTRTGVSAIRFNIDPEFHLPRHLDQVAFRIGVNRYNGHETVQMIIEEIWDREEAEGQR